MPTTIINPSSGIIQTVQTHYTTANSQSLVSNTIADIVGITATITPKYVDSLILVSCRWSGEVDSPNDAMTGLRRNGASIGSAPAAGSRMVGLAPVVISVATHSADRASLQSSSFQYLDSPASIAALVYTMTFVYSVAATLFTNRSTNDVDSSSHQRGTCTITLQEIRQ